MKVEIKPGMSVESTGLSAVVQVNPTDVKVKYIDGSSKHLTGVSADEVYGKINEAKMNMKGGKYNA